MNYRHWPDAITGNEFTLAKKDPDTAPDLKVRTWSNIFDDGGLVAIDANGTDLATIRIDRDGDVTDERAYLQDLVDDWNEDAPGNWRRLIEAARVKVRGYYEKQITEAQDNLRRIDEGVWS